MCLLFADWTRREEKGREEKGSGGGRKRGQEPFFGGEKGSGAFFRPATAARGALQSELPNRVGHPFLRAIRPAPPDRLAKLLDFFLPLRLVQPLQVAGRFGRRPRAQRLLLFCRSVKANVDAGVRPLLRLPHQAGALRISFHIPHQRQEMAVRFHQQRFVPALINVAIPHRLGFGVITLRVGHGDALQELRQIAVRSRVEDQMPMIRHQAISQKAHGHQIQALRDDSQESLIMT